MAIKAHIPTSPVCVSGSVRSTTAHGCDTASTQNQQVTPDVASENSTKLHNRAISGGADYRIQTTSTGFTLETRTGRRVTEPVPGLGSLRPNEAALRSLEMALIDLTDRIRAAGKHPTAYVVQLRLPEFVCSCLTSPRAASRASREYSLYAPIQRVSRLLGRFGRWEALAASEGQQLFLDDLYDDRDPMAEAEPRPGLGRLRA